jgi:aminotransferase
MNRNIGLIPPSGIRKFFDLVMATEGIISLGVGEPDFVTPWNIRESAIYSLEKGYTTYTSNSGMPQLREKIAEWLQAERNVSYSPEDEILVTVGVSEGFDLALRCLLNPGDEIIIPEPCFVSYKPLAILSNAVPVTLETTEQDNFEVVPEMVKEKVTKKTKALILNYPNNPTGATISKKAMEEIAALAIENDFYVISDEIYSDLVYEGPHTCFSSLNGVKERTILLNGFSKSYAMTGLRIGYVAAPHELASAMNKIHQYAIMCAPTTGQMAALEALKNGKKDLMRMKEEYNRRRRIIVKGFNDIGLRCFSPKGAFYAFPSIKSTGLSSEKFAEELLKSEKVAVVPGNAFGSCGEGYVRCSYATSMEDIKEALERMERFCENLKQHS